MNSKETNMCKPSPRPWRVNGHSIEADDGRLWLKNDKTGKRVVANLPSVPKWRYNKAERAEWDALTEANARLIVAAVNAYRGNANEEGGADAH